ncbi:MAG: sensor histidine kinase, partial [Campylobacterota bacterium]|nr:sensor histidine kinase [Campylobacterota bacterium]
GGKMMKVFLLMLFSVMLSAHEIEYYEQSVDNKDINITQASFLPYDAKHSNFGFTKSTYWLKVELENREALEVREVLHFPYTLLDYIDIYELEGDTLTLRREYGDLRIYSNDSHIPDPSFKITLKPHEKRSYFFKIKTQGSMNLELLIKNDNEFILYSLEKITVFSFYFGAVIIMLIYNMVLYLYIKDRSYLYYMLFHMNYIIFALSLNGFSFIYFWPDSPWINSYAVVFLMSLGSTLAVVFTIDFLDIKGSSSRLYLILRTLFYANILVTFLTLVLSYYHSSLLASLLSIVSIIIIIGSSIYSYFTLKNQNAKFFIFAWGTLLMGIFIIHFRNMGLLEVNFFTSHSPLIGAFIELTLLSLALAYRYNIQQEELAAKDVVLHKQSRLASMGEMIANIAHQWRQPLNRVNIALAVIKEISKDETADKALIEKKINYCEENIAYMSETIDDFSDFFKPDKMRTNFKLCDALDKVFTLVGSRVQDVKITYPEDKSIGFYGFENEYVQVLLVIVENALDSFVSSSTKNSAINISTRREKEGISLMIEDNGGGISSENIDYIFDPYFTTKFKKEGTGIGLYMAKMLVENSMNGELSVESKGIVTIFKIRTRDFT